MNEIFSNQPIVAQILQNSFLSDRLSHAYLFVGQRGTGKMKMANAFTQLYLCEQPFINEPCGECSNCKRILSSNHPDVHRIVPDGNSIKKEQIQQLQKEFILAGVESNRKVYIIEHVDRMTSSAANSLLKFLEEPNEGTLAILLTEQSSSLLDTILSRCQVMNFLPLKASEYLKQLKNEGVPDNKVKIFSALTNSLDEVKDWKDDPWFDDALEFVRKLTNQWFFSPMDSFLTIHEEWKEQFSEKNQQQIGTELLILWLKDLLYLLTDKKESIHFVGCIEDLNNQAQKTNRLAVANAFSYLTDMKKKTNANVNAQLALEQATIRLVRGLKG